MERHEVDAFLAVAEELHFRRAAERLRLSTARVSQTIQRLERRVGAPLFERTSRMVTLTPMGRQFRDDLEPARALTNAALGKAIAAAREVNRVLRVGFLGPTAGDFLLATARAFGDHRPECEISLRETACLEDVADDPFADVVASVPDYWRDAHLPRRTPLGRTLTRGPAVATLNEILLVVAAGQAISTVDVQVARRHPRRDISYLRLLDTPPFEMGLVWRTTAPTDLARDFVLVAEGFSARRNGGAE
ncbi:LysR family transcriptional regulator [Frankia gtarii]|uniref:LysR family transcriptional regulator n=1 Tax=Frankia gtarii TaxID=2950102 RepID=UPI0021BF61C9|nr:LysR family transcriptional regulator [Frankia gtarii]